MQSGWSDIKDSGDFFKRLKKIGNIPENAILVTADVARLYPNTPHNAGLKALSNMLEAREHKVVSTEDLVKMAHLVLENNYFEFNGDVKKQISGTAIGTKFALPYASIFMDDLETNFYNPSHCNLWYGLDTSMTFSLFGLMATTNLKSS